MAASTKARLLQSINRQERNPDTVSVARSIEHSSACISLAERLRQSSASDRRLVSRRSWPASDRRLRLAGLACGFTDERRSSDLHDHPAQAGVKNEESNSGSESDPDVK